MRHRNAILGCAIAIELIAGVVLAYRQKARPAPLSPLVPELSHVDPFVAAHIRELAAKCTTPGDWAGLGEVYLAYGYFTEAEACYRVAVAGSPNRVEWVHHWGFSLERLGKVTESNEQYERAIELGHPDPTACWYYIGRNHLRLEKVEAAQAAFQRAADQPAARYELARLLVRGGKPAEAMPIIDRLASEHPNAVHPPLLRHKVQVLAKSPAAAESGIGAHYTPDQLPNPFYVDWKWLQQTHDKLGLAGELKSAMALHEQGLTSAAMPALKEVYRLNCDIIAVELLSEAERRNGNPAEALRLIEDAIDRVGPSAQLLFMLGEAHAASGRLDRAVDAWTRASRLGAGGRVKNAYYKLALHFEKAGDSRAARRNHAMAYLSAAHEVFWNKKPAEAQEPLEKALEYDPDIVQAWYYLGEIHRLQGGSERARTAYERCLSIDPNFGRAIAGRSLLMK